MNPALITLFHYANPYSELVQLGKDNIVALEKSFWKIKDSIGHRRRPSSYSRKFRGRQMRQIEKEWRVEKTFQKHFLD